jgi:hypothetical protein
LITFKREKGNIKIHQNDKRIYVVPEKAYQCLTKMGFGYDHVISMIEELHET